MSVCSNSSTIISFRGDDDVDVNDALDVLFKELQENLNYCHTEIRNLAQCEERDEDFLEAVKIDFEIQDYSDNIVSILKELKVVSKSVLGKCPAEYKDEYKKMVDDRKAEKQRLKEAAKQNINNTE